MPLRGSLAAWDFVRHRQFLLSPLSVRAIVDIEFRNSCPQIVRDLVDAKILVEESLAETPIWSWDIQSKIFHFGTLRSKPEAFESDAFQRAREYVEYCNSILKDIPDDCFATISGAGEIPVDEVENPILRILTDLLDRRRSNRTFSGESLRFSDVSTVVDQTFRYRPHDKEAYRKMGMTTPTARRSSPSGGSLQSCEGYLIARKVSNFETGVFHFRSHQRTFGFISALPPDFSFGALFGGQFFADDLSAAIVITCRFDKLMWKYKHSHSYRVALFDAGHLSQKMQLIATALGIRTWVTAAFYDDELRSALRISASSSEYPLLVVGLGTGPINPFDIHLGEGFFNQDVAKANDQK